MGRVNHWMGCFNTEAAKQWIQIDMLFPRDGCFTAWRCGMLGQHLNTSITVVWLVGWPMKYYTPLWLQSEYSLEGKRCWNLHVASWLIPPFTAPLLDHRCVDTMAAFPCLFAGGESWKSKGTTSPWKVSIPRVPKIISNCLQWRIVFWPCLSWTRPSYYVLAELLGENQDSDQSLQGVELRLPVTLPRPSKESFFDLNKCVSKVARLDCVYLKP